MNDDNNDCDGDSDKMMRIAIACTGRTGTSVSAYQRIILQACNLSHTQISSVSGLNHADTHCSNSSNNNNYSSSDNNNGNMVVLIRNYSRGYRIIELLNMWIWFKHGRGKIHYKEQLDNHRFRNNKHQSSTNIVFNGISSSPIRVYIYIYMIS